MDARSNKKDQKDSRRGRHRVTGVRNDGEQETTEPENHYVPYPAGSGGAGTRVSVRTPTDKGTIALGLDALDLVAP